MLEHLASIGNKLQLFFRIFQLFCLISILSQTHLDGLWHYKVAGLTNSCLTVNFFLVPLIISQNSGMESLHMYV